MSVFIYMQSALFVCIAIFPHCTLEETYKTSRTEKLNSGNQHNRLENDEEREAKFARQRFCIYSHIVPEIHSYLLSNNGHVVKILQMHVSHSHNLNINLRARYLIWTMHHICLVTCNYLYYSAYRFICF